MLGIHCLTFKLMTEETAPQGRLAEEGSIVGGSLSKSLLRVGVRPTQVSELFWHPRVARHQDKSMVTPSKYSQSLVIRRPKTSRSLDQGSPAGTAS